MPRRNARADAPLIVNGSRSGIVRNGDTQAAEVNRADSETLSYKITDLRRLFDNFDSYSLRKHKRW